MTGCFLHCNRILPNIFASYSPLLVSYYIYIFSSPIPEHVDTGDHLVGDSNIYFNIRPYDWKLDLWDLIYLELHENKLSMTRSCVIICEDGELNSLYKGDNGVNPCIADNIG